jgi:DUF4097 and DUF4098 domain-containing protein YvlB
MSRWLGRSVLSAMLLSLTSMVALAQREESRGSLSCRDNWSNERLASHCEIKEQSLAPTGGVIAVDGRKNGGVAIKGWEKNQILVRARVQTGAPTQNEADELAKQVTIETAGAKIFAAGPEGRKDYYWHVSFEVFVPLRSDLAIEAHNGGISIADVHGRLEFKGVNGGVVLKRVGGSVHGGTTNGGVILELSGDRWDGEALDVQTTNGGIVMSLPQNYSAHLETSTVNGNLSVDFPVTVQGRITKELAVDLGAGGATVRATTTNGGVRIKRLGSANN